MEQKPNVSIIMASYNSSKYLLETVKSIQLQSYHNWELCLVDDCSIDNTQDLIRSIALEDKRISYSFNEVNSGAAVSRNKALEMAEGRYIAFLDSDDIWKEDKIKIQLRHMEDESVPISFSSYGLIDEHGLDLGKRVDVHVPFDVNYNGLLRKVVTFGCSTVMVDRLKVGDFKMPLLRTGQDYATWLSILKKGFVASRVPETLTFYRITPGSISRNKFKKALRQWEIYREIEGLGLLVSIYYMCNYAWRAVFRR